jgi:hypothetical protein
MGCGVIEWNSDLLLIQIEERKIHLSLDVGENAQVRDLGCEPVNVRGRVGLLNAEQDEQASIDFGGDRVIDRDTGGQDTLNDGTHD